MNAVVKKQILDFYAANKAAVDELAVYLNVPALWLVSAFYQESGLRTNIQNSIGAVGLNQMLPSTLAGLGVTVDQYKNGTVAYQLSVIKRFFAPIRGKIKRAGDLYLYNFYPAAVLNNYPMDYPIGQDGNFTKRYGTTLDTIYDHNSGLDYNHDKTITRGDVQQLFESKFDELVSGDFFFQGPAN